MDMHRSKKRAIRVSLTSMSVNVFLIFGKISVGIIYHSQALIMDGVHSLSDFLMDGFVILINQFTFEDADEEHPYGHGRFETLGTVVIGCLLISVAFYLAYENIDLFLHGTERMIPAWPTMVMAAVSIVFKEGLYQYGSRVGKAINSRILQANAWHDRSDAISSIIVFIGLGLAISGLPEIDIVMAIGISLFIGKLGWDFIWKSIKELLDTSLDETIRTEIKNIITGIPGVKDYHNLRSRKIGDKAILDVNIEVAHNITVSEGHEIATRVAYDIMKHFDNVYDVTVHTDVEDDREEGVTYMTSESRVLPLRNEVLPKIESILGDDYDKMEDIKLHYIHNQIHLDLIVKSGQQISKEDILSKFSHEDLFGRIKFLQEL